jgi:sporulation protein YlmC with PRC-barrel domain
MRLGELLGLDTRTESGDHLGRVYDVRAELTPRTLKVTGLVVGELGLLERLGLRTASHRERLRNDDVMPWSDIVRVDRRGVVVRDAAK